MKVIFFSMAGLFMVLVAGTALVSNSPVQPERKDMTIVLREIGHTILLQAGDSTSRVLPVKETAENVFLIEFQGSFTYVPDSLVKVVTSILSDMNLQPYIVHVLDCSTHQIMYGFQIGKEAESTIVPCLGRVQPKACYMIQISFADSKKSNSSALIIYALTFVAGGFLIFGFIRTRSAKQIHEIPTPSLSAIQIGAFMFDPEYKHLIHANEKIELSEKENKVLNIFATHQNEIVSREQLMKTVWEDEGVIVGRSLDVFVSKLRKKLKADPGIQLVNIHGVGYRLEVRTSGMVFSRSKN